MKLSQIKRLKIMNLEEVKKVSASCVYRITFPDGKFYVGQTINLRDRVGLYERRLLLDSGSSRVMSALCEFGIANVEWDILCSVEGLSGDDLKLCLSALEIKYIRDCGCLYPKGYNTSVGGEVLGIPADVLRTSFGVDASGYGGKLVLVYDANGRFVKEYSSLSRCAYGLGVSEQDVRLSLGKRGALLKDTYMLREKKYAEIPRKIIPFRPEVVKKTRVEYDVVVEKKYIKKDCLHAAIMYDANGEYVGLFDSSAHSKKYLGLRPDWKIPYGREFRGYYLLHYNGGEIRKSLGAFTSKVLTTLMYDDVLALGDAGNIGDLISFKIPDVPKDESITVKKVKKSERLVSKYTLDGEYLESYDGISSAANANNVPEGGIRACCDRRTKTSGGFIFRYSDDTEPVVMKGKTSKYYLSKGSGRKETRKVNQYTLGGKYIRTFVSVVDAAREMEVFASGIRACCKGATVRCGDYRYVFADEDEKSPV